MLKDWLRLAERAYEPFHPGSTTHRSRLLTNVLADSALAGGSLQTRLTFTGSPLVSGALLNVSLIDKVYRSTRPQQIDCCLCIYYTPTKLIVRPSFAEIARGTGAATGFRLGNARAQAIRDLLGRTLANRIKQSPPVSAFRAQIKRGFGKT
jgi:hypothetical protein